MPPTVYRALDFLLQQKLIHRIASLNAYIGCIDPGRPHSGQHLICRRPHSGQHLICRLCGTVAEVDEEAISGAIAASARDLQFSVERQTVEVTGICVNCVPD